MSMQMSPDRRPLESALWIALMVLFLGVGSTVAQDPSGTEEPTRAREAEAEEAEAAGEEGPIHVDEEGRRYRIVAIPKDGLAWERLDEERVRISWGITIWPVDEDAEAFYVRDYVDIAQPVPPPGPSPEEVDAIQSSYQIDVAEVDRLRFVPAGQGLPETGQWRNGFEVADMNEDGHLDIVHGTPRKSFNPPVIFLGDSEGSWTPWADASFPALPFDYGDVTVADFNGDGHLDVATASHLRGVLAMVGDGKGNFRLWSEGIEFDRKGEAFSSRALEAADWNGDGRPDLLVLGEGPRLQIRKDKAKASRGYQGLVVYLNQGDGTWVRRDQGTDRYQVFGDDLALGDFNRDGRPDVVTASNLQNKRSVVMINQGDGSWEATIPDGLRPQAYLRALAVADYDGDGRDDLAVTYMSYELSTWHTGIDVFLSREGDRPWERRPVVAVEGREGVFALDAGDLDGDGHADLVGLTGDGAAWVFLGDGTGGFAREQSADLPPDHGACRGYHVRLVDFDRDGRDEVIAAYAGEATLENMLTAMPLPKCSHAGALRAWDALAGPPPVEEAAPSVDEDAAK